MTIDYRGKVALVTGGAKGIGSGIALQFASSGARIAVIDVDAEAGIKTVGSVSQNCPQAVFVEADLSIPEECYRATQEVATQLGGIDVLINNAGTIAWTRQSSSDGIELTFALNHLSYFLLTNLLIDVLRESAPSRIVNVSSVAHMRADIDLDDIQNPKRYRGLQAYGQSKLANLMFTYELARRLEGTGVTVNALHPGLVATNLAANGKMPLGWISRPILHSALAVVGRSVTNGSKTVVYLATAHDVAGITGKYFVDKVAVPSSAASYYTDTARRLWELSSRLTNHSPGGSST